MTQSDTSTSYENTTPVETQETSIDDSTLFLSTNEPSQSLTEVETTQEMTSESITIDQTISQLQTTTIIDQTTIMETTTESYETTEIVTPARMTFNINYYHIIIFNNILFSYF